MLARVSCLLTLGLALMTVASAQTINQSTDDVPFTDLAKALPGVNEQPLLTANCPFPLNNGPHCIYYAGDFNAKPAKFPNGLLNGRFHNGAQLVDGEVWVPIPIKNKMVIKALFVNELFASPPPATAIGHWGIRQGIGDVPNDGGTLLCSGTDPATLAGATGRSFVVNTTTYLEYTYLITITNPERYCTLTIPPAPNNQEPGVEMPDNGQCPPHCFASAGTESSAADANGAFAPAAANFGYLSDVTTPQPHHRGLANLYGTDSFFNSAFYHKTYVPVGPECQNPDPGPPPEALTSTPAGSGCVMFSIGLIGTGH